jgi:hypothetical protein
MENSAFRKKCCAITQIGEPDESDRAHSRTRLKYVPVGSNASSLTHTVLEQARSLFPACATRISMFF